VRRPLAMAVAALALTGMTGSAWAANTDVAAKARVATRYEQALQRACETGVVPGHSIDRLSMRAKQVNPNLPDPQTAFEQCLQEP